MKVGVLTFHEIFNPGAYLQTLGTVSLLRRLGHSPVIINYTSPPHRFSVWPLVKNWRVWRHPVHIAELFGRNRAFETARNRLPLSIPLKTHADVERLELDAVLIGADIVWDYATPHLGKDPVYFGDHLNANKRIAFAVSCGSIPWDYQPLPDFVQDGIRNLTAISVRDLNTQKLVERLGRSPELICDPAFHLELDSWNLVNPFPKDYLLVYGLPQHFSKAVQQQTKAFAKSRGLTTIAVCYRQSWVDRNDVCIGPDRWLAYIRHAKCVVTGTFHGTVFSLREHKAVAAIRSEYLDYKVAAMRERLPISRFFVEQDGRIESALNQQVAWPIIDQASTAWADEARSFVTRSLSM